MLSYATQPPAHLIVPRIWLGNKYAAHDPAFLADNNITAIVNASKDIPFSPAAAALKKYRVPVDDNLEPAEIDNMSRWGPEIVHSVLAEYYAGGTILIHCAAGVQRSAAITAMTLVALRQMSPDEAMTFIKTRRPVAFFPGANFGRSIREFHSYYTTILVPALRNSAAPQRSV
jgi:hypothetical protein